MKRQLFLLACFSSQRYIRQCVLPPCSRVFTPVFPLVRRLWCLQLGGGGVVTANNADLSPNLRSQTMYQVALVYLPFTEIRWTHSKKALVTLAIRFLFKILLHTRYLQDLRKVLLLLWLWIVLQNISCWVEVIVTNAQFGIYRNINVHKRILYRIETPTLQYEIWDVYNMWYIYLQHRTHAIRECILFTFMCYHSILMKYVIVMRAKHISFFCQQNAAGKKQESRKDKCHIQMLLFRSTMMKDANKSVLIQKK